MKAQLSSLASHDRLRRLRVWQVLAVVVLCLGLVTCAKAAGKPAEPTGPTGPTGPTEPEPPEPDQSPADDVERSLRDVIVALGNPERLVVSPESLVAPPAGPDSEGADVGLEPCPMTSTGPDATDGDGDNYPVHDTRTFGCVLLAESELLPFSLAGSGSLVLRDKDDADPASGVTAAANSVYTMSASDAALLSITSQVSLDAATEAAGADYAIDLDGSVTALDLGSLIEVTNEYEVTLTGSFQAGTMTVEGTLATSLQPRDCTQVDASMREQCQIAVSSVEAADVDLTVTSTGLTYDTVACPTTVFTGGSFQVSGAGNTITLSYGACGERTVTPVPPAGS